MEQLMLRRGSFVALCVAAIASGLVPVAPPPLIDWMVRLVRDLSFLTTGFILLALGMRRVRSNGTSYRTLAYPAGGVLVFAFLIAGAIAGHHVIESAIPVSGPEARAQMHVHLATVRGAGIGSVAIAVAALLVGALSPVHRSVTSS